MISPIPQRHQEYFTTQLRCLTGLQLLSNILLFAATDKNGFRREKDGNSVILHVKKAVVRGLNQPLMTRSSVSLTKAQAPEGASKDLQKYREVRSIFEEIGLFRHHSGQHPKHKSPPCLYSGIDLKATLKIFQWLYAQFLSLQAIAIEKGRKVLQAPKHHFSIIRSLNHGFFAVAERSFWDAFTNSLKCCGYFAFRDSMDEAIAACKQDIDKEFGR